MSNGLEKEIAISAPLEKAPKMTNIRWLLLLLLWLMSFISYLDRVNISVCGPLIMKDYGFDKVDLGILMSAFYFTYMVVQIPGSLLVEKFGVRKVGAGAVAWWSVFTAATPLATGFASFFGLRALFGLGEGPLAAANGTFIARWFNKKSKALVSGIMLSGYYLGPAIGPVLAVWIIAVWGWQMVFYSFGAVGLILAIIWYIASRDFPHQHSKINAAEVEFICEKTFEEAKTSTKHETAPWKKFLLSSQFWALGIQEFIVCYVMYVFLSWLPIYLLESRGLSMKAMGIAAAYPWLAVCAVMIIWGKVSDILVTRGCSKFQARTIPAVVGLVVSGVSFYLAANAVNQNQNIFWLTMCLAFTGFTFNAAWASCQDLGLKFGGAVLAWVITWANVAGVVAPTVTAFMAKSLGWQNTLSMISIVVALGSIVWFFVKPDKPLPGAVDA